MTAALADHPLACLFPLLAGDGFHHLVADVKAHGLLHPIVIHQGMILDGRNRYRACVAAGVPVRSESYAGDDPAGFVISSNLHRRHLDESQRAMIAANLADMQRGSNQHASIEATSQTSAAEKLNVSRSAVQRAAAVRERGIPELCNAVEQGKIAVSVAAKLALLPAAEQQKAVAEPNRAKHLAKRHGRTERELQLADKTIAASKGLGTNLYGVIYADPPWRFEPWSRESGMDRAAENHYPTMTLDEIKALRIPAAPDCVLWMWATVPMNPQAHEVLKAWGFTYKSKRYWEKPPGTGFWFPNQVEELLVATRGNVPAPAPGTQPPQIVRAPSGRHSEKPEVFAQDIERLYPATPKLEMFARRRREGWDSWGNEAESPRDSAPGDSPKSAQLDWLERDSIGSYYAAIAEIGKRVRAGEPVPLCLRPRRGNSRSDDPGGPA